MLEAIEPIRLLEGVPGTLHFALRFKVPTTFDEAARYTAALVGIDALFTLEPLDLYPMPVPTGRLSLDRLIAEVGRYVSWDDEIDAITLLDLEPVASPRVRRLRRRIGPAERAGALDALAAFASSVRAGGPAGQTEAEGALMAEARSVAIIQAFRAIESVLGGPLPARDRGRLTRRLRAIGLDAEQRLPGQLVPLLDQVQKVEILRNRAAHGGRHVSAVADVAKAQAVARALLRAVTAEKVPS